MKKTREHGTLADLRRSGRPRITSAKEDRLIVRQVRTDNRQSARQVSEAVAEAGVNVSSKTVLRRLKEDGFVSRLLQAKPPLKPHIMAARFAFARKYRKMPLSFWEKVIFSDESKFELITNRRRERLFRKKGEAYAPGNTKARVKHSPYVMVWGCFSYHGVGRLVTIPGRMTSQMYTQILSDNVMASAQEMGIASDFVFQHDNDPKHKARLTREYLRKEGWEVLEWPSYSPDCNPIEHLWEQEDRQIPKRLRTRFSTFNDVLHDEWKAIEQSVLQKLVHSMPERLEAVYLAKGGHTRF